MKLTKGILREIIKEEIKRILIEGGGESSGKLELVKINFEKAKDFAEKKGLDIQKDLSDFEDNFKYAQKMAKLGKTKRKDMPVINDEDVKKFQKKLEQGEIDIFAPFSDQTPKNNPFPTGLTGTKAAEFLKLGLKDGQKKDDIILINIKKKSISNLKPIQQQIYYDKSMGMTIKNGIKGTKNFLKNKTFFITSSDDFIIDGHHRWLSALLVDPNMKVNTLSINLPITKLLPMTIAYGDAIGNKRNK